MAERGADLQTLTLGGAAIELGTDLETVEEIIDLGLAPYYNFGWGRQRILESELPRWRGALAHLEALRKRTHIKRNAVSTKGCVYFVQCERGGPIKIGTARNVEKRFSGLQASCPYALKLLAVEPGGEKQELQRHAEFMYWRLHGEWFREDCLALQRVIREIRREWGAPRKNRVPRKISKRVESGLIETEEAEALAAS